MVKAKGNVNTPMAKRVQVAVEEEGAIISERLKRNHSESGQFGSQEIRHVPRKHVEHKEARLATTTCYLLTP